jgi:hypothetical protein
VTTESTFGKLCLRVSSHFLDDEIIPDAHTERQRRGSEKERGSERGRGGEGGRGREPERGNNTKTNTHTHTHTDHPALFSAPYVHCGAGRSKAIGQDSSTGEAPLASPATEHEESPHVLHPNKRNGAAGAGRTHPGGSVGSSLCTSKFSCWCVCVSE